MKYVLVISYPTGRRVVGPFNSDVDAIDWATKNIDGRIYPYKVVILEDPTNL